MKNTNSAALKPAEIEGVLCAKYHAVSTAMITLSATAVVAAVFIYSEALQAIPRDYITLAMLALLCSGWSYLLVERARSAKRAAEVARILGAKFKPRYDAATGCVHLDAIEKLSFGGEETESVVNSVMLSRDEAKMLNDLVAMMKMKETLCLPFGSSER
jgi:hypothetical protein